MTEKEKAIYELGLQKQAELDSEAANGALSPQQVSEEIKKIASAEAMAEKDIPAKVAVLVFNAAMSGDVTKTASLMSYLG